MTRLVDLIGELDLELDEHHQTASDCTSGDVSEIQNIIFEPELEELFFQ